MISVHSGYVSIYYLHEDHLLSEETVRYALFHHLFLAFGMRRWDFEFPMEGILRQSNATERDLINGIYLFQPPRRFVWGAKRTAMHIQFPLNEMKENPTDMVSLLEVSVVCTETGEMTPYSPPVLTAPCWYNRLPRFLHWIFRWVFFGWAWMCC